MRTAISVRLPQELASRLDNIAQETERPRTFIVQKALEAYLDEYGDSQVALDRLRDQADAVMTSRDVRKSLGA